MYAVVGCSECGALWIVEGRPETTSCPRCGRRHQFERLKNFVETDDEDHAREARAAMVAERGGEREAFDALGSFGELEAELDDAGVSDAEYLEGAGLDPEEVAAAAETDDGSSSRRETVLDALGALDRPTEAEVVAYATAQDVPEGYVREALEKLVRAGAVTERDGRYRRL